MGEVVRLDRGAFAGTRVDAAFGQGSEQDRAVADAALEAIAALVNDADFVGGPEQGEASS